MKKGITWTACLIGLWAASGNADSIRVGGEFYPDVYVTETSSRYIIKNPADGSTDVVSKKRVDVTDLKIDSDERHREEILERWQAKRKEEAVAEPKPVAKATARAEAVAVSKAEAAARAETEKAAARAKVEEEAAKAKARQEAARVDLEQEAQMIAAGAGLPSAIAEYVETSQRWGQTPHHIVTFDNTFSRLPDADLPNYRDMRRNSRAGVQPLFFRDWIWVPQSAGQRPSLDQWEIRIGRVGYIDSAKILQIIDRTSVLVCLSYNLSSYLSIAGPIRVYSWDLAKLCGIDTRDQTVMVRKTDTSGHVDGEYVQIPGIFQVTGTTQYTTVAGGPKTVFVLEPFNLEPYRNVIPAAMLQD